MIAVKELRAEAKRALGPTACISKKHPPFFVVQTKADNLATARLALLQALQGMPDFEGAQ